MTNFQKGIDLSTSKRRQPRAKSREIAVVEKSKLEVDFEKIIAEMHGRFDQIALEVSASLDATEQALDFTKAQADVENLFDNIEQVLEDEVAQVEAEAAERDGDPHKLMLQSLTAFTDEQDELDGMLAKLRSWMPPWVSVGDRPVGDASDSPETS